MTKAQQVYERVEALVAGGSKKADAFRQVADELGMEFNSARGAYYSHTRKKGNGGDSGRTRKRETTALDAIAAAVETLKKALSAIDAEVVAAKTRADEAKTEYEALRDGAAAKKKEIEARITALQA